MTTSPTAPRAVLAIAIAASIGLSACSGAAPVTTPSADPTASAPVTTLPTGGNDPGGDGGGGSGGDPGSGVGTGPVGPTPIDPAAGQPLLVRPVPGRADPHPVAAIALQASIDGRHVLVKISWYGGVEPCSVLDSVRVERSGTEIALTPIEGASDPQAICIEIAVLKATIVDLGELDPGSYRISAPGGDAKPVLVSID